MQVYEKDKCGERSVLRGLAWHQRLVRIRDGDALFRENCWEDTEVPGWARGLLTEFNQTRTLRFLCGETRKMKMGLQNRF